MVGHTCNVCNATPVPELHFMDGGPLTAQYLLVVDALNFCFWPGAVDVQPLRELPSA